LAHEGYVVLTPRRGARVAQVSTERTLEIMEVRRTLEVLAVRKAAEARGGTVVAELRATQDEAVAALEAGRFDELHDLVERFHHLIAVASGSEELVTQLAWYRSRVRWVFDVDVAHRAEKSWSDHQKLIDVILAGDARKAATMMDAHVARDEHVWIRLSAPTADTA
jgi:DNA-binding GntR family transcriptional regulator